MSDLIISPEQSRAARGWLGWTQEMLAKEAGLSLSTVRDFETTSGKRPPRTPIRNNREAMREALERAGIALKFSASGAAIGIAVRDADF